MQVCARARASEYDGLSVTAVSAVKSTRRTGYFLRMLSNLGFRKLIVDDEL